MMRVSQDEEKISRVFAEQERAAQLLVRRDLELTQANDRLRALDEAKSNFITVVAHQLRTPLSGIKWTLNLIMKGDLGSLTPEQKEFLAKAYASNDRMIALVNDMLRADRVESGELRFQFGPVDIVTLVQESVAEIVPRARARGVSVRFADTPTLPLVRADADALRAALQNLLENALKYSRENGMVVVELSQRDEEVVVAVRDDGIGIPRAEQSRIFDRFFRAPNALKVETDGSGLGLFIVKNIVERHGGRMWFESTEGKGSVFYFTIPFAEKEVS